MLIGLYTSRVVLSTLGASDYGVYNVVGGVISLFSFLSAAMAGSTQRFLTYEIGKGNEEKLRKVFSVSFSIQFFIGLLVLFLAETIGLWLVNTQLNIPADRMSAARIVYQLSIISCMLGINQVPYNALISAREKMNVFAYISIYGAVSKLILVIILSHLPYDKLVWFALFIFAINVSTRLISRTYCIKRFKESKLMLVKDWGLYKEIGSFAGWNLIAHCTKVARSQGVNIVLNVYFGPIANAARGIAQQVQGMIMQLVDSFQMATVPQITKSYASGDVCGMNKLITRSSKLSVMLLVLVIIPFFIEADSLLQIWLGQTPQYSVLFARLCLAVTIVDAFSGLMVYGALATGMVKKYQIVVSSILSLQFIITWIMFFMGMPPQSMYLSELIIYLIGLFARLFLLKGMVNFPIRHYIKEVVMKSTFTIVIAMILPTYIHMNYASGLLRLILVFTTSCITTIIVSAFFVFNREERTAVIKLFRNKIKRKYTTEIPE